ncbi:MAG: threonine/serine exporter family protein [Marinifilaceae bacterium]|jgi:uncharacterized membrane protein YjjP (DUF1212 family)
MKKITKADTIEVGSTLLETGSLLMSSGASTMRIRHTMNRIAQALGYNIELMITHRALSITLIDGEGEHLFSRIKRISPHGVNFRIVSGICHMSWNIVDDKWNIEKINAEIARLKALPHYPRIVILILVALADAGFCHNFGGGIPEMITTIIGTFFGLYVRQEFMKRHFNPYICVFLAALTASFVTSCSHFLPIEIDTSRALSTCVLFLIPGVPLINSITDLIDGNLQNGIIRGINGLIISFSIALGLLTTDIIFKFILS